MNNHIESPQVFARYMAEQGIPCSTVVIGDGEIHRFHVDGDKRGSLNGWYVLHLDGMPAGSFGSWRLGVTANWCAKTTDLMTAAERREHYERMQQMRMQRDAALRQRHQQAADRAGKLWKGAASASSEHPYLRSKGIQSHHLRQNGHLLLVPMIDATGKLWNLQRIYPDGTKRFLSGGRVKGCFTLLGDLAEGPLYVCEGVATGATIYQQSGLPTVCAMNAGNLLPVCTALADPKRQLTVCADNDHHTQCNPGITKGREAAAAVGAGLTWPEPCGRVCICTDFNDVVNCTKAQEAAA